MTRAITFFAWVVALSACAGSSARAGGGPRDPDPSGVPARSEVTSARASVTAFPAPPTTTISLTDWGLADPHEIRFGRLALIHESGGPRLEAYVLSETAPPTEPSRPVRASTPDLEEGTLVVSTFRSSNRNRLGGFFNPFFRSPSSAEAHLATAPDGRRALHVSWEKRDSGWSGVWFHLFGSDATPGEREYLDARSLATLTFWIRGAEGREALGLKVADAAWEQRQDALPVGPVADFVPAGRITREWQLAVVPLDALPSRIDRGSLATLALEAAEEGRGEVWVGPLGFAVEDADPPGLPEPDSAPPTAPGPTGDGDARTATWVWNTDDLLASAALRERLAIFVSRAGADVVFLQVPSPGPPGPLAELVSDLAALGVRVYALDGFAGYVLPRYRSEAMAVVDRVVRYNASVPEAARFHGFRHDIEPYLLPGFHGPRREALLQGYLEVATGSARRVRDVGMVYGLDIPFWYDAPGPLTPEPVTVTWNGSRKTVSEHAIDLADDVAVMAYRTAAWGADGTLAHAEGELAYADRVGTAVYVGLETAPLPDETRVEFRGEPRETALRSREDEARVAVRLRGDSADVSYLPPGMPLGPDRRGGSSPALTWEVTSRTAVPAAKLTFAERDAAALARVMEGTAAALSRHASFTGFAIHHWESHRTVLSGPPPSRPR